MMNADGTSTGHVMDAAALSGNPTGQPIYQLLVYVDDDPFPQKLSLQAASIKELCTKLIQVTGRSVSSVSYFDEDFKQFIPIRSLEPLREHDFKGKIKVETSGVRIVQVLEEKDPLEYAALREHVDRLSQPKPGYAYALAEAHRIINPQLEESYKYRRKSLIDPTVRSMMLFYTNNARPSEQVVQHGFALPTTEQAYHGGIIFASDIDAQPAFTTNLKFLLCEVSVGRSFAIHAGDRIGDKPFDSANYDSMLNLVQRRDSRLEEWVIFHPEQAIPRYIVTCTIVKSSVKANWNSVAMGCDTHPGESLKLWCVDCRKLMCPYCMTIGAHKGHDGRDIAEVAMFEKQVVTRMFATLDSTIVRRQGEVAELERVRAVQESACKGADENVRHIIHELHQLLDAEEKQLLANLSGRKGNNIAEVDRCLKGVQSLCAELQKKYATVKGFMDLPVETSQQARMEFLAKLPQMLEFFQTPPSYDDPSSTAISMPELQATVSYEEAKNGIQSLSLTDARATGAAPLIASVPKVALDTEIARLKDIESGYIWVIPNAYHHFAIHNAKDIYSDVFTLLGCSWEIRLAAVPEEHISVYVHAAHHTHRMDFKVTLFSPKGWYVRYAQGWSDNFKGRGWGIRPFADKKSVLETYVVDGVLKVCVTPTSGLY